MSERKDIVERLRVDGASKIEWEAAARIASDAILIERLRTALRGAATVVRASADEIERLRGALKEIVEYDGRHYAHDGNARIVNVARAALGEPKP
jgi:hypothetical protein